MDPKSIPLTFFRKASGLDHRAVRRHRQARRTSGSSTTRSRSASSSAGTSPSAPSHRAEPGRLHRRARGRPTTCRPATSSCRKTQFYEAKSYPTFTPVGPALVLLDADELKRFGDLRLRLRVNGEHAAGHARRRRHDLPAAAGAAGTRAVPATSPPAISSDRHAGRHRSERATEADRDHRHPAAAGRQVEGVLQAPGQEPEVPAARRRRRASVAHRRRRHRPRHPAHRGRSTRDHRTAACPS